MTPNENKTLGVHKAKYNVRTMSETEKQDRETSGMCPLMGPTGKLCNTGCAWYIKERRGCAIAILARDSGR